MGQFKGVATIPSTARTTRILLAYNGSKLSQAALETVIEQYRPIGATIISDNLYEPFKHGNTAFYHGYTFGGHPVSSAVALANLILNGVLERFPRLRIGVVELTASWVPSFLLHIDGASDFYTQRHGQPFRALADRPSEYFRRQVRVASLPYEMPNRLVPKVGDDTFMIGSDWPHAEGVADPMAAAERAVAGLTGPARANILGANAAWLLGL